MLLLTGPAGSGKTAYVLEQARQAIRRRDRGVRLLTPTATLAEHYRNLLAREGLAPGPDIAGTLSRFVEEIAPDPREASSAALYLAADEAVAETPVPAFMGAAGTSGFAASLARTVRELSAAGCDAARLRALAGDDPLSAGLASLYEAIERSLGRRGLALRAIRLRAAANASTPVHTLWFDGFHAFSDPEIALIEALSKRASLTLTLPDAGIASETRARLLEMGAAERRLDRPHSPAPERCVAAPGPEREADEIARRILERHAAGVPFREMAVALRGPDPYAAILRGAFERFSIPARFYFDQPLAAAPPVRFLAAILDALQAEWDWEACLRALRLAPVLGASPALDSFEYAVRPLLPGKGLAGLAAVAGTGRLRRLLDEWATLDNWRLLDIDARQWAARLRSLRAFVPSDPPAEPFNRDEAAAARARSAALDAFEDAVGEAESWLDDRRMRLPAFWRAVAAVLRLSPFRPPDGRRDVVPVLSVFEARQWRPKILFVPGLLEGAFPAPPVTGAFLPEALRRTLRRAGIRVRTAADAEREEAFLFDSMRARASGETVLSYPRTGPRGEKTLRSEFLEGFDEIDAIPARTAPRALPAPPLPPDRIDAPALLARVAERHPTFRVTRLETFLTCPFQFFANATLGLRTPPPRVDERLDARVQGTIVHRALAEWTRDGGSIRAVFDRVFNEETEKARIQPGYATEAVRIRMEADLERFAATDDWPAHFRSEPEAQFEWEMAPGVVLRGRMDRLDRSEDGRGYVIDYKYSKSRNHHKNDALLQGPLYLLAAEARFNVAPAGFYYCSLRDGAKYMGWGDIPNVSPRLVEREWLNAGRDRALVAIREIREGRIEPSPADPDNCRYCDFKDVCRFDARSAAEPEDAAGAGA